MTNLFTNLSNWKVKYTCALLMFVCVGVGTAWGATFTKITSLSDLTTGNYVIVGQKGASSWGRLRYGTPDNSGRLAYTADYTTSLPSSITTNTAGEIWYLTVSGTGTSRTVTIYNTGQKMYLNSTSGKLAVSGSSADWTSKYSSGFRFAYGSYYLGVNKNSAYWRDYAGGNSSVLYNTSGYVLTLYKEAASCSADPTVGNASLNGSFSMTSTTSAIGVSSGTCSTGNAACDWTDYGFVWSDGTTTTTPTVSNNKVQVNTTGSVTSWTGSVTPSGSTTPTSWTTGHTYYVRTYGKNSKASASYYYSETALTFTPRSVTFNLNGHGSSTPSVQYVNNGDLATDPSYSESVTGYAFGGWYDNSDWTQGTQWNFGSSTVSGGNVTLYAKWTANEYTITLNQDLTPTSAGTTSITATYNSYSNLTDAIDTPTKDGWTFAGYFTAKNGGGTQIIDADGNVIASAGGGSTYTDASKNWKYANDITLYAKWTCTVTWSVNGLTNVYSAQTLTYNGTSTKVASVPDGEDLDLENDYCGDKFVGWTTTNIGSTGLDKDDDASEIADLNLFTDVAGSPELKTVGNQTFYAVFANYDE